MEIKRKLMSNAKIAETERAIADQISEVFSDNKQRFADIGYELDLRFEYITDDDYNYSVLSFDEESKYPIGYVSRATITVKRPKGEADEAEAVSEETVEEAEPEYEEADEAEETTSDEAIEEAAMESEPESDAEQEKADRTLRIADEELKRSVAFTQVMLVRIYKTFWIEKISKTDSMDQLKEDLDEFYARLSEKSSS